MSETTDEGVPRRAAVLRVLSSESFLEKFFLLVATAFLTGLLIPSAIKYVDTARERREVISRANTKLFEEFSETIITAETLILDVTWYGSTEAPIPELQKKAFDRYSEQVVQLVTRWRLQISRAHTLASPSVAGKMQRLLDRFFIEQDTPVNRMWVICKAERPGTAGVEAPAHEGAIIRTAVRIDRCEWNQLHARNEAMLGEANALIVVLAHDLGLSAAESASPAASGAARAASE
jgi:hypothetical protein